MIVGKPVPFLSLFPESDLRFSLSFLWAPAPSSLPPSLLHPKSRLVPGEENDGFSPLPPKDGPIKQQQIYDTIIENWALSSYNELKANQWRRRGQVVNMLDL